MNLLEGTRRLALLLGAAGAIACGFVSYLQLDSLMSQKMRHSKFEQLATSDAVMQERKAVQASVQVQTITPEEWKSLSPAQKETSLASMTEEQKCALAKAWGYSNPCPQPAPQQAGVGLPELGPGGPVIVIGPDGNTYHFPAGTEKAAAVRYFKSKGINGEDPYASSVVKDGIKTIHWTQDYGVESIETEDGQTLYPTRAPAAREYLLVLLFPFLGFFIPWVAVRTIGWVAIGFAASPK